MPGGAILKYLEFGRTRSRTRSAGGFAAKHGANSDLTVIRLLAFTGKSRKLGKSYSSNSTTSPFVPASVGSERRGPMRRWPSDRAGSLWTWSILTREPMRLACLALPLLLVASVQSTCRVLVVSVPLGGAVGARSQSYSVPAGQTWGIPIQEGFRETFIAQPRAGYRFDS